MYLYFQYEFSEPLWCNFNCVYGGKELFNKKRGRDKIRCLIIGKAQQHGWDPHSASTQGAWEGSGHRSTVHNCAVFTWVLVSIWWSYHLPGAGTGAAQEDLTTESSHLEGPAAVLAFYRLICAAEMSKCPLEDPTISFASPAVQSNNRC